MEQALASACGGPAVQAAKERQARTAGKARQARLKQARVSTADPEARVMKLADGGFRPAYNVQMATDVDSQVVVGVAVINRGTDQAESSAFIGGEGLPMEESFRGRMQRTGCHPGAYLVDGGFVDLEDIGTLERLGVQVYAPPKRRKDSQRVSWKPGAKPGVLAWRERMETEEGRTIYQHRASTAECVNALARERYGVRRFTLRGVAKVSCAALLVAISHNRLRWATLRG